VFECDGKWIIDVFFGMVDKFKVVKKKGVVFYNWWGDIYSWVSVYGGKVYDGDKFVFGIDFGVFEVMRM